MTRQDKRTEILRALKETPTDELRRQFEAAGGWPDELNEVDRDFAARFVVRMHPKCGSCGHVRESQTGKMKWHKCYKQGSPYCDYYVDPLTDYCPHHSELHVPQQGGEG